VAELEAGLLESGLEVLVDDRDQRPGVKLSDADLIGIPLRLTLGERSLVSGEVELKQRAAEATSRLPLAEAPGHVAQLVRQLLGSDRAQNSARLREARMPS
jgi:prolyl-tRNA synthetase